MTKVFQHPPTFPAPPKPYVDKTRNKTLQPEVEATGPSSRCFKPAPEWLRVRDVVVLLPFFAARPEKLGDRFCEGLNDSPDRIQEHRHAATVRLEENAAKSR